MFGRHTVKPAVPRRARRKLVTTVTAIIGAATVMLGSATSASAGIAWQSQGYTGSVVEAALPGQCYNTAYGYDVVATGPSVYGYTAGGYSREIARWNVSLWDTTSGTYRYQGGWSAGYWVTASSGVNFGSQRIVMPAVHADVSYADVSVEWLDPTGSYVIGWKDYLVSTYGNGSAYLASHC